MDFTIKTYKQLLESLQNAGFSFLTFAEYITKSQNSSLISHHSPLIVLRHDVDALPQNSLRFARIQAEMGIKGAYYFRAVPQSWDEAIIKEIHSLGHEVGYHYENMDIAFKKLVSSKVVSRSDAEKIAKELRGLRDEKREVRDERSSAHYSPLTAQLLDAAYEDFQKNLEKLRQLVPVSTICMHGSPLSKYDNRDIWQKYDYKKLDILAEPYFDIDFNHLFYLTDTGRCWDGHRFNVRDKPMMRTGVPIAIGMASGRPDSYRDGERVEDRPDRYRDGENASGRAGDSARKRKDDTLNHSSNIERSSLPRAFGEIPRAKRFGKPINQLTNRLNFHSTHDIIRAIESGNFPKQVMFNFHPQRWHSKPIPWLKQFLWQNAKNQAKRVLIAVRRQREVKL